MEFKITHEATIEADSEEEARKAYIERWRDGWYSELDVDIEPEEGGGQK